MTHKILTLFRVKPVIFGNLTWCLGGKESKGRSEIKKRVMICKIFEPLCVHHLDFTKGFAYLLIAKVFAVIWV